MRALSKRMAPTVIYPDVHCNKGKDVDFLKGLAMEGPLLAGTLLSCFFFLS